MWKVIRKKNLKMKTAPMHIIANVPEHRIYDFSEVFGDSEVQVINQNVHTTDQGARSHMHWLVKLLARERSGEPGSYRIAISYTKFIWAYMRKSSCGNCIRRCKEKNHLQCCKNLNCGFKCCFITVKDQQHFDNVVEYIKRRECEFGSKMESNGNDGVVFARDSDTEQDTDGQWTIGMGQGKGRSGNKQEASPSKKRTRVDNTHKESFAIPSLQTGEQSAKVEPIFCRKSKQTNGGAGGLDKKKVQQHKLTDDDLGFICPGQCKDCKLANLQTAPVTVISSDSSEKDLRCPNHSDDEEAHNEICSTVSSDESMVFGANGKSKCQKTKKVRDYFNEGLELFKKYDILDEHLSDEVGILR